MQSLAGGRGEDPGGDGALVWRLGRVVALDDLAADAALADELAHRPKEVELQAEQRVEALQHGERGPRTVAVIADEATHGKPVALLGPRLIVLPVRAPAREADPLAPAPVEQQGVEKLAAVVAMPLPQGERQACPHEMDGGADALLVQPPERLELGPAGGDVHGDEAGQIEPVGALATVQDEIALEGAGGDAVPVAPRAQRDLGPDGAQGRGGTSRLPAPPPAQDAQMPIQP